MVPCPRITPSSGNKEQFLEASNLNILKLLLPWLSLEFQANNCTAYYRIRSALLSIIVLSCYLFIEARASELLFVNNTN